METKALPLDTPIPAETVTAGQRMRRGRHLVTGGFMVSIAGIIGYCVGVFFGAGASREAGAAFLESPDLLVGSALGMVALGTLLWLAGSFVYLHAAMEADAEELDLYS